LKFGIFVHPKGPKVPAEKIIDHIKSVGISYCAKALLLVNADVAIKFTVANGGFFAMLWDTANPRLVIAVILAGVALALAIFGMFGDNQITGMQTGIPGHASLAASYFAGLSGSHVPGLIALTLAGAAFGISSNHRSFLVAGLLSATGILYTIHLAPFLGDHSIIAFPGPVVGLFIGHLILALEIVKGIESARAKIVQRLNT
jgi:hypothetical protein